MIFYQYAMTMIEYLAALPIIPKTDILHTTIRWSHHHQGSHYTSSRRKFYNSDYITKSAIFTRGLEFQKPQYIVEANLFYLCSIPAIHLNFCKYLYFFRKSKTFSSPTPVGPNVTYHYITLCWYGERRQCWDLPELPRIQWQWGYRRSRFGEHGDMFTVSVKMRT